MMLQIRQASLNQIALTLSEKADPEKPFNWLFRFVSEQSKKNFFCNLTDLSPAAGRYNLFHLYEDGDINLPTGEYTYFVYQMDNLNDEDFTTGNLCETGKARVVGVTSTVIPTFNQTTVIKNIYG